MKQLWFSSRKRKIILPFGSFEFQLIHGIKGLHPFDVKYSIHCRNIMQYTFYGQFYFNST